MLTSEQWWGIMALYGAQIWPAQVILYLAAVAVTLLVLLRPGNATDNVVRAYMAFSFGWTSIVFFLLIGHNLFGNLVFTALFGVVALLFAADFLRKRMQFHPPTEGTMRTVVWAIALLIFAYPAFSLGFGHSFPRTVVLGTFPCPNTALGLFMLTLALPRADKLAYGLLLFWSVPLPPAIQIPQYGVYEDAIMLGVGLYALALLALHMTGRMAVKGGAQ